MLSQIAAMLSAGVASCIDWFTLLINRIGLGGLIIAAFIVFQSYRLLLAPLMGQAGSDQARKREGDGDE